MHRLVRQVRFSVNPFLSGDGGGANSFASRPAGEGLAVFLELCAELVGEVDADTGFVVNVTQIDKQVRAAAVPVFVERIREDYRSGRHIALSAIAELLRASWRKLAGRFGAAKLAGLSVKLNPYRRVAIDSEDGTMVYFSEKFEFAAMHKLWNEGFSEERNFKVFGKCANPAGHGHNYVVEVTIKGQGQRDLCIGDFERVVDDEFIKAVDHKNLNVDVEQFGRTNPTVENIAVFAWDRLADKFGEAALHSVTIWETDRTSCSYYG